MVAATSKGEKRRAVALRPFSGTHHPTATGDLATASGQLDRETAVVGWWWVAGKSVLPVMQQFIRLADARTLYHAGLWRGATLLPLVFFPETAVAIAGGILFGLAGALC